MFLEQQQQFSDIQRGQLVDCVLDFDDVQATQFVDRALDFDDVQATQFVDSSFELVNMTFYRSAGLPVFVPTVSVCWASLSSLRRSFWSLSGAVMGIAGASRVRLRLSRARGRRGTGFPRRGARIAVEPATRGTVWFSCVGSSNCIIDLFLRGSIRVSRAATFCFKLDISEAWASMAFAFWSRLWLRREAAGVSAPGVWNSTAGFLTDLGICSLACSSTSR